MPRSLNELYHAIQSLEDEEELSAWRVREGVVVSVASQGGRNREIKIARMQDVTLVQARKKAQVLRAEIALDGDPAARRDQRRAVPTFRDFVVERYLPYVKERLKSYRDQESFCRLRLLPCCGRL